MNAKSTGHMFLWEFRKKWKADKKQHLENVDKNFEGEKGLMTLLLDVLKLTE